MALSKIMRVKIKLELKISALFRPYTKFICITNINILFYENMSHNIQKKYINIENKEKIIIHS